MTSAEIINTIGIPTVLGAFLYIGTKLKTLDKLESDVENVIKPDLKDVRERFATLEGKSADLFAQHSPISLTEKGEKILSESGLKDFISSNEEVLHARCKKDRDMDTPYDIQQAAFEFLDAYEFDKSIDDQLKTYAFNQGITMDSVRRIGAIYFRDLCLAKSGHQPEDLDTSTS